MRLMPLSVSKALNALLPASLQGNPLAIYGIFAGVFALLTVSASVRVCACERACNCSPACNYVPMCVIVDSRHSLLG